MEKWRAIPGFPDYKISDAGRVRSVKRRKGARAAINGGVISGWVQTVRPGYKRRLIALRMNGETHIKKIHRLVLESFIGPCPEGEICLHRNGDSLDNRLINLHWGTPLENTRDSISHGRKTKPPLHYGERHHNASISTDDIRKIRSHIFKRGDQSAFAKKYGVAEITISRIRRGLSRATE